MVAVALAAAATSARPGGAAVELADVMLVVLALDRGCSCWTSPRRCSASAARSSNRINVTSSARRRFAGRPLATRNTWVRCTDYTWNDMTSNEDRITQLEAQVRRLLDLVNPDRDPYMYLCAQASLTTFKRRRSKT
jgi:hypothetical protein